MMINRKMSVALFLLLFVSIHAQNDNAFQIARLKYNGGGDWYNDPSAEVNLLRFVSQNTNLKVKPEYDFVELPFTHGIYNIMYDFSSGPPKTHKHDENPTQGFGIFIDKRLAVYYTYESNPSDGWADPDVHKDPQNKREEALKFGTHIAL